MAVVRKYYGPFLLLFAILAWSAYHVFQSQVFMNRFKNPQINDIYIFQFDTIFSPFELNLVEQDSLYFYTYPYDFKKAAPTIDDIDKDAFNNYIHYIYSRSELEELLSQNKIIKIYR